MTPIPHWPGRLIALGDHEVYVRSVTPDGAPGAGEPALCVHGLEGSSRNWTDLMDVLRPRLDGDALDLPGFGDSPPRPDGRYSMAAFAQTIARLVERRVARSGAPDRQLPQRRGLREGRGHPA